ncbi:class I SAM-dependent methyltransferase [Laspinema palackyanum]|uniref:class I SAM-dependent methyltransferase n=1 Tax=Laspinema palackyanum TaxID=3231601 RepID=UPI00345D7277|nr:class I SAM-dependent methyltransferase [Laspinema sp. D2c]
MKFEEVKQLLEGVPFMTPAQGKIIYDFIIDNKVSNCLELGFAHGVSSCYIAAALDEIGGGNLTTVDLISTTQWRDPSIEQLLSKTGLEKYVTVVREQTSYTWFLKKQIEKNTENYSCQPIYDFCFIDGSKNWTIDGFAFCLADKLLKQGGWVLFDDYNWTYGGTGRSSTDGINHEEMGEDELNTPHIELLFRLVVMQHPDYSEFKIQDEWWAWARKKSNSQRKTITVEETQSFKALLKNALKSLAKGGQAKTK